MINKDNLKKEIYEIISESITEEERKFLNLKEEQIVPTIDLFRNIKWQLTASYMMESHGCEEINEELSWTSVKDKENVNFLFLGLLCIRDGINFEITKETIKVSWHISLVEKDITKEYHL